MAQLHEGVIIAFVGRLSETFHEFIGAKIMRKRLAGVLFILLILTAISSVAVAQDQTTLLWGMWGSPEEIASLALYLCSDEAGFITGSDYPIDGGFIRINN